MAPLKKYHVFLSFRGEDVRKGFLSDLDKKLQARAIVTFKDDRELKKGNFIDEGLKLAIEQSRFSIVVVSKNYAESAWCLRELAHIVQCMQESGRIVPIFYGVEPKDVRHQTGSFAQQLTKHEKYHGKQVVCDWKRALTELSNHSGWDSKEYSDKDLIKNIVDSVWEKVHDPDAKGLGSTQDPAERDGKLKRIDLLLNPEANDVQIIGIWGKDEIGIKTTAELVRNRKYDSFEASSILSDIRTVSKDISLVYLQIKLLEEYLNRKPIKVPDVYEGKKMIESFVRDKKVLLILDDVDQQDQLEIIGGQKEWYGKGSRIIITSTDKKLLAVDLGIKEPYLVEGINQR